MAKNMRRFREMFHVPAERMDYYYMLRAEMPDPISGVIGYILNDTCDNLRILIEVDDAYMKQRQQYTPYLYLDPEDFLTECRVVLSAKMARMLVKKDPIAIFELWHEVGHFHTMEEHVEEYLNCNASAGGYTAEQYVAIMDGVVLPGEAAADDFAADYVGKEGAIIALNGMISQWKKNPATMNDRGGVKSMLNRKTRIVNSGKEAE